MEINFDNYDMFLIGIGEEFADKDSALEAYNNLADKLIGKNYFVVTLNMDDIIYLSRLNSDRIVAPLGTGLKKQCPDACDNLIFDDNTEICPKCGKALVSNNILCENYIEQGYMPMWEKHKKWLTGTLNKRLLVMELGVSLKLPQIVRWPFERIAYLNDKAFFVRVNSSIYQLSAEVANKGDCEKTDAVSWLKSL